MTSIFRGEKNKNFYTSVKRDKYFEQYINTWAVQGDHMIGFVM